MYTLFDFMQWNKSFISQGEILVMKLFYLEISVLSNIQVILLQLQRQSR
jgi:hypothetical protein